MATAATRASWRRIGRVNPSALVDPRLQLHHAAQIIVSVGISYLEKRPDDSHTNLEWLPDLGALGTNWLDKRERIRFAVRPADLSLLALDSGGRVTSDFALDGRTVADGVAWLRDVLSKAGYDAATLTTKKHYEIPPHPVASGATFSLGGGETFAELERYYANAQEVTSHVAGTRAGASAPRCWPHHFDLATLITLPDIPGRGSRTVGVGLSPGDGSYAEPYFYVGPYPHPSVDRLRSLGSLGAWHTQEWVGAVLRAGDIAGLEERRQGEAVHAFVDAAIAASIDALSPQG